MRRPSKRRDPCTGPSSLWMMGGVARAAIGSTEQSEVDIQYRDEYKQLRRMMSHA